MTNSLTTWQLDGESGRLVCGDLAARAEISDRGVRLLVESWESRDAARFVVMATGGPLEKSSALQIAETYVRGCDLVAAYAKTPPHQVAPHLYFRAAFEPRNAAVRIEMIISMQTDLLDSSPLSVVHSVGTKARLLHVSGLADPAVVDCTTPVSDRSFDRLPSAEHLFLLRDEELGLTYAEMVHPSDFVAATIDYRGLPARSIAIESTLFPERLEKGVIRRSRMCGWFLPAENDLETAIDLARRFVNEPPPLTT